MIFIKHLHALQFLPSCLKFSLETNSFLFLVISKTIGFLKGYVIS